MYETTRRKFLRRASVCAGAAGLLPPANASNGTLPREYRRGGMVYRKLGNTDLHLSLLGFGSHIDRSYRVRLDWGSTLNKEGQQRRDRQILQAADLGVNLFDVYDNSSQWAPMAKLIKGRPRDKFILSLKKERPEPTAEIIDNGARLFGHMDLFRFVVYDEGELTGETLEKWDIVRKGKEAGKIRAIGIATHDPATMMRCLRELEGLDFIFFPFNFIHSRVAYSEFLPAAVERNIGLLAMKPLGTGSIVLLDPNRPRKEERPEGERLSLNLRGQRGHSTLLAEAVEKLTEELNRRPDETLAQAALRFVFAKRFLTCALPGMWRDAEVDENYRALEAYAAGRDEISPVLDAALRVAGEAKYAWLPRHYQWLDQRWWPSGGRRS